MTRLNQLELGLAAGMLAVSPWVIYGAPHEATMGLVYKIFFYHSNTDVPGIVGIATVASPAYPDESQFNRKSKYYDEKSTREEPRWVLVDVKFERKLARTISLDELKARDELADMPLVRKGNRLSVMPVAKADWDFILKLEKS